MKELAYSVLDVFAERALEGNPLAVFHDGRGLSTEEMQALARETNLAETTFVIPSGDVHLEQREGVQVRIFTVAEELPFAGHPTLGTATWLFLHHPLLRGASTITLQLKVGPISVTFEAPKNGEPGVRATMRQNDPHFGAEHEQAGVAGALGLAEADLALKYRPQTVSTGVAFCVVLLRSLEVCARLQIVQRVAQPWLEANGAKFFYCIAPAQTRALPEGPHWHARMQFYNGEDPATGSAAGCCVAWLVRVGLARPDTQVVIEQGVEMKRPSRILGQASMEHERVHTVLISGRTVPVAEGRFFLPG